MPPVKGRGVTWATIQKQPIYGAIWDVLQSGPKTYPQLRGALQERRQQLVAPLRDKLLPGTLVKRLHGLRKAGLVSFESRPDVLRKWKVAGLFHPDSDSKRGPRSGGAWWLNPVDSFPVQVALALADHLTKTPKENLAVERTGNGADLLVAGSPGDIARWWYPAHFDGQLGVLFELIDRTARELCLTILAKDPEAVAAQEKLRDAVRTHWSPDAEPKVPPLSVPEIRQAADEANKHRILVSVAIYPAHWWDGDLPVKLTSKAALTLARIHERTRPRGMPLHAVSREEAARWRERGVDMSGGWVVDRKSIGRSRRRRRGGRPKRIPSLSPS